MPVNNKRVGLSYKLVSCPCSRAPGSNKCARSRCPHAPALGKKDGNLTVAIHVDEGRRISDREGTSVCTTWYPVNSVLAACSLLHTCMHRDYQRRQRHGTPRIVPKYPLIRLGFRPAQACTRILASIPRPCHPHPDNPDNPYRPIHTVNPSRPFLARPDRPDRPHHAVD